MNELMNDAKQELKRVEHLFYVSLKYTRTADVIRNVIERMINSFMFGIDALLKHAKENKLIEGDIPPAPRAKSDLILSVYPEDLRLLKFVDFYTLLRDIRSAPYTKREEYRRHVTMTSELSPGKFIEVNIDVLSDYQKILQLFLEFVQERLI